MPGDENENVALAHLGPVGPDDDVSMVVKWLVFICVHHSQPISVVIQVVNHFWGFLNFVIKNEVFEVPTDHNGLFRRVRSEKRA
jgi:hypothetical protein